MRVVIIREEKRRLQFKWRRPVNRGEMEARIKKLRNGK